MFPEGLGTALITPMNEDYSVDYEALNRILDDQLRSKVDYIVVLGTTGEPATLSEEEKADIRRYIVQKVGGKKPLVLGVGGNCTQKVCEELRTLDELPKGEGGLQDFAAILSVCPYYNKPNQEGLFRHFVEIAKASTKPVILYNVPGRTGVNMLPETVMRIHEAMPNQVIAIKEASGNEEQIADLIIRSRNAGGKLRVISGDDGLCYQLMQMGAVGLISVLSNAYPDDVATLVHEHKAVIQAKYEELISLLFKEGNPVGIKEVLRQRDICQNIVRLPLAEASAELQEEIKSWIR